MTRPLPRLSRTGEGARAIPLLLVAPNNRHEEITLMKTFGLATVLALLLAAPAVAATDENIGIETLLKDGWQVAGYAAANQFAVELQR